MSRYVLFAALVGTLAASSFADPVVIFMEEFGDLSTDLSNSHAAPTPVGSLPIGESMVAGAIENADREDIDIFTFTIDANQVLDSILLAVEGDRHFLAISEGTQISDSDVSSMLTARLISSSDENDNLLTDVADVLYGGTGLSSPLGAGDYTIWLQETQFVNFGYAFTFQTSAVSAIPEASSGLLLGALATTIGLRRRRSSR